MPPPWLLGPAPHITSPESAADQGFALSPPGITTMRLLLLTEGNAERWDAWSGTAKSVVDHLRLAGHQVTTADVDLYGPSKWATAAASFSPNRKRWGVRYHLGRRGFDARSARAAAAIAHHRGMFDCILQIGATFEPVGRGEAPYALFCDSNIVTSLEGAPFGVSDTSWLEAGEYAAIHAREARIYAGASAILTISEFLRRSFISEFGIRPEIVSAVGAGPNLDLSRVPHRPSERGGGPPTVLFVGKQFERKGGAVLLEAFKLLRARIPHARLVVIGPTAAPAPAAGVSWLGNLDKNKPEDWARLVQAYRDADVFCLPSLFEPFGIVILEAMFFGLPCVGTAEWAIPEMIDDGQTGYTVPRGDAGALADRLEVLLADPGRAREMGRDGRQRAERLFTWPAVVAKMTEGLNHCSGPRSH